jgi:hypothetical protein
VSCRPVRGSPLVARTDSEAMREPVALPTKGDTSVDGDGADRCSGGAYTPMQQSFEAAFSIFSACASGSRPSPSCYASLRSSQCNRVPPKCSPAAQKTGSRRRFGGIRLYMSKAAHNPEIAGSNPAPATAEGPERGLSFTRRLCGCRRARRPGFESRRLHCSLRATGGCMSAERGVSLTPEGMRR